MQNDGEDGEQPIEGVLEFKGSEASEQCCFRKDRSTADDLVLFDSCIRDALAKKEHVFAIFFLNLEKAYDTTWKHGILSDLYDFDFRGHLPTFIDGFPSAGSTIIRMSSKMGLPQLSIFGSFSS